MSGITQFINVNILDELTIQGVPVVAGEYQLIELLDQNSTATSQEPVALDTPLRIEFGPANTSADGEIEIDNTGLITVLKEGRYRFDITINFGRTGAAGISQLLAAQAVNGVVLADSTPIYAQIDNANLVIPGQFIVNVFLPVGVTLEFLLLRDSSGNNSGGLFSFTATTVLWPPSPTATILISKVAIV